RNVSSDGFARAVGELGLKALATSTAPTVRTHSIKVPRIAVMHTWLGTQSEGWWRMAFDSLKIPYDYISTQVAGKESDLRSKYDVIIFAPVGRSNPQAVISGMPMWGNALPWKATELTPNLGKIDETDDMRPGLGWSGLANLQTFVRKGGLLLTATDASEFAVSMGLTQGVAVSRSSQLKLTGTVVRSKFVDTSSPIAYGYGDSLSIYCYESPIFTLSNMLGGRGGRRRPDDRSRATGRGTIDDPDSPQDRAAFEAPEEPKAEVWQATPLTDEQRRNGIYIIPPSARPRVVLRYADAREL